MKDMKKSTFYMITAFVVILATMLGAYLGATFANLADSAVEKKNSSSSSASTSATSLSDSSSTDTGNQDSSGISRLMEAYDNETSDMPTFYVDYWPADMTPSEIKGFVDEYGGVFLRLAGVRFDQYIADGHYADVSRYIEYDDAVDGDLYDEWGFYPQVSDSFTVYGIVDTSRTDRITIIDGDFDFYFYMKEDEWWKDDYEWEEINVPQYISLDFANGPQTNNYIQFYDIYGGSDLHLYNVRLVDFFDMHISVEPINGGQILYCHFDDYDCGIYDLKEGDYINVWGHLNEDTKNWISLYHCEFIKWKGNFYE